VATLFLLLLQESMFASSLDKKKEYNSVAEPHHFYAAPDPAPDKIFDAAPAAPAPAPAPTLLYSKAKCLK
jgi:hypothetical protein